jgi:hypothetical protein
VPANALKRTWGGRTVENVVQKVLRPCAQI